jgi:hypothetical protein
MRVQFCASVCPLSLSLSIWQVFPTDLPSPDWPPPDTWRHRVDSISDHKVGSILLNLSNMQVHRLRVHIGRLLRNWLLRSVNLVS